MHSLLICAAVVLIGVRLFFLALRLVIDLGRVWNESVRSLPTEGVSGAVDAPIDDVE